MMYYGSLAAAGSEAVRVWLVNRGGFDRRRNASQGQGSRFEIATFGRSSGFPWAAHCTSHLFRGGVPSPLVRLT